MLLSAIILAVTYLIDYVFGKLVIRALANRSRNAAYEIARIGSVIIWVGGILSVLPILGASDTVISVVILLVGAFLILATRDFSSNWFAGQMIRTIAPFKVGDWIKTSGSYGRVSKIESLYTTLVTTSNETVVIPNSRLTSEVVVDRTTGGSIKVPVEVDVDPGIEFGKLSLAVLDIASDLSNYLSEEGDFKRYQPETYVVSNSPEFVRIRVVLRINNPAREDEVVSEFRKRFASLGLSPRKSEKYLPER
ncbi:MAG: mechanosensitive ion channel domain-containing protein [Nitrososphaerales archaeon]